MNGQIIGFFGKALVITSVFGVFAFVRKYFRVSADDKRSIEDLNFRFRRTKWIVASAMVLVGGVFLLSTHAAFVWLNWHIAMADGPAEFRLLPQTATWWFFPGFGAVALSWEITLQLWSYFGSHEDANLYSEWSNIKPGFDARKVLRWMSILIVLPIGVLTILELPVHSSVRREDIRDCGYAFSQCKLYSYAAVRRMTMIDGFRGRDGKLTRRAGIVLDFSGGRRWNSADRGDFQKRVDPAFVNFLEKKTGLTLNYAETEADISSLRDGPPTPQAPAGIRRPAHVY